MEKCPICGCEKETCICQNCSYDESKDIIGHRTVRKPSGLEKKEFQQLEAQSREKLDESRAQEIDQLLEALKIRQQDLERERADIRKEKIVELAALKEEAEKKANVTETKTAVKTPELKLSLKEEIEKYWLLLVIVSIVRIIWTKLLDVDFLRTGIYSSVWCSIGLVLLGLLYASLVYSLWKCSGKFCMCWNAIYIASGPIFVMSIGFLHIIKLFVTEIILLLSAKLIIMIMKKALKYRMTESFAMAVSSLAVICTVLILQLVFMYVPGFVYCFWPELYLLDFGYYYTFVIELAIAFIFTYMLRNSYRSKMH